MKDVSITDSSMLLHPVKPNSVQYVRVYTSNGKLALSAACMYWPELCSGGRMEFASCCNVDAVAAFTAVWQDEIADVLCSSGVTTLRKR